MIRPVAGLLVAALVGAACTSQSAPERDPVPQITTTSSTVAALTDEQRAALGELTGRLLILGRESVILTVRPDGSDPVTIAAPDPTLRRRTVPTWSPDATLIAWTDHLDDHTGTLHVTSAAGQPRLELALPIVAEYIDWAPDASRLAVMGNDPLGEFRLLVVDLDGAARELATGAPMSVDWDAAGARLLVRVQESAEIIEIDSGRRTPVEVNSATRLASFLGDGIITSRDAEPGSVLQLVGDRDTRDLLRFGDPAAYVVHPDGDRLAVVGRSSVDALAVSDYAATDGAGDPIPALIWDRVTVVTLDGGVEEVGAGQTVSVSWSPDGTTLHWATLGADPGGALQWHSNRSGSVTDYPTFVPGGDFARSYLAFFDQFERSVTLWSPDSRAWAYAGGQAGTTSAIWVQLVDHPDPIRIAPGSTVSWSPR